MYVSTMPAYHFSRSPYGVAPPRFAPGARFSGQRQQRQIQCTPHLRQRRRLTLGELGLTATPTEQAGTAALATGASIGAGIGLASSIGAAAGPVGAAIGAAIGIVMGLITSHHSAAVATEANTLNAGTPGFLNAIQSIMSQLNAGTISPTAAISALQSAQSQYYSSVSGIIKKGGACVSNCIIGGGAPRSDGGTNTSPNCCNTSGTCNAACCLGCSIVEPTVTALTKAIQAGGGSYTVASTQTNGSIQGTPAVTLTYNGLQGGGGVTGAIASIPTWYYLAGGGVLLLLFLMR